MIGRVETYQPSALSYQSVVGGIEPGVRRSGSHAVLAAVVCFTFTLLILLPRLGDAPLGGTEGHRAVTAHQMLRSHAAADWLVPKLYGRTYLRKPPGFYWILASVERVTGQANEWVWRLPSVLSAGLLAAALALFGHRWFGIRGAWGSGLSYAILVALWAQSRTVDIDSVNTLVTTACALGIVELHFGNAKRPWIWMLLVGMTFGASLLLKFHAGMPVILGVLVYSILHSRRQKTWSWVRRPWSLGGLDIGACIFLLWAGLALVYGLLNDTSGLKEAIEKALPVTLAHPDPGASEPPVLLRLWKAALVPPQLFLFSLPLSLAIPIAFNRDIRRTMDAATQRLVLALTVSVLASWAVCTLAGMTNVRYGNITLPMLCPIVGALVAYAPRFSDVQKNQLRLTLTIVAGALVAAQPVLLKMAWKSVDQRVLLIVAALIGIMAGVIAIYLLTKRHSFTGALPILASIAILSVPLAARAVQDRFERSGFIPSRILRQTAGTTDPVVMGAMLRFQPELFYYSGVNARAFGEDLPAPDKLPTLLPGGAWLVVNEAEYAALQSQIPTHLSREVPFVTNNKKAFVVWYQP